MKEIEEYFLEVLSLFVSKTPSMELVHNYLTREGNEKYYEELKDYIAEYQNIDWMTSLSILDIVDFSIHEAKANSNIKVESTLTSDNKVYKSVYKDETLDILIKKLWTDYYVVVEDLKHYCDIMFMDFSGFKECIKIACKIQAIACNRRFVNNIQSAGEFSLALEYAEISDLDIKEFYNQKMKDIKNENSSR